MTVAPRTSDRFVSPIINGTPSIMPKANALESFGTRQKLIAR